MAYVENYIHDELLDKVIERYKSDLTDSSLRFEKTSIKIFLGKTVVKIFKDGSLVHLIIVIMTYDKLPTNMPSYPRSELNRLKKHMELETTVKALFVKINNSDYSIEELNDITFDDPLLLI